MGQEVVNYGSAADDGTGDVMHVAFAKLDAGARLFGVIDKDLTAPPGSPGVGDCYIVGASPTGAWAGRAGDIAIYGLGTTWLFIDPVEGMGAYIRDENALYVHSGSAWAVFVTGSTNFTDLADVPGSYTGAAGKTVKVNGAGDGLEFVADSTEYVEIALFAGGVLDDAEVLLSYTPTRDMRLPTSLTGSDANAEVAATGSSVFTLKKNGSSIGTVTYSAAGTTGAFSFASDVDFTAGTDKLTVTGPTTADVTLADVSMSFKATLL